MRLTLIGYRGTGKTTVARLLSQRWQVPWWDADAEVERRAGRSIKEIFAADGEAGFRAHEERAVAELMRGPAGVVALGGGAILSAANREAIRSAVVVWLTANAKTLDARISGDPITRSQRPDLTADGGLSEIEAILREREPLYRAAADHIVSTEGKTADQVAAEIVCLLRQPTSSPDGCP